MPSTAWKIVEETTGVERRELNRRAHEEGDQLARVIGVLAMDCESQEYSVLKELQEHQRTLGKLTEARNKSERFSSRSLTSGTGASLAAELGQLEGMFRALVLMAASYKND
jgi:hypothetical protein